MYYAVYAARRYADNVSAGYGPTGAPAFQQVQRTEWYMVGVFGADSAENACKAAAKKNGAVGSYFAVEGYPWGIDMMEVDAVEFGSGDPEQMSKLKQLENRSREMEKDAGLD